MGQLEFEGFWDIQGVKPGRQLDTQVQYKYGEEDFQSGDPHSGIISLEMLTEGQSRDKLTKRERVGRIAAPTGKGWAGGLGRRREGRDVWVCREEAWF